MGEREWCRKRAKAITNKAKWDCKYYACGKKKYKMG
jgi:hypothetical protein